MKLNQISNPSTLTPVNSQRRTRSSQFSWVAFTLFHIPLSLAMSSSTVVSTGHALLTFLVCGYITLSTREPRKVAWVSAYICGSELLWRMTGAGVFWEFGKYAIIILMVLYLLRKGIVKSLGLPLLYFGLLTISIPLTIEALNLTDAREAISFNLSGPLSLAVSALFFYQIRLSWEEREVLIWSLITPIIGIITICLAGIISIEQITFSTQSNFTTSGGYGPNQVSAVLGLGALLLIILSIKRRGGIRKWLPLGLALCMVAFSALTFSRGGLYNLVASLLIIAPLSLRSARLRNSLVPILIIALIFGGFFIYPRLDQFTGGMLEARFLDLSTTGRTEIMQSEINLWKSHPIFGVGPGVSLYILTDVLGKTTAAHTEYTRMIAEHGIMGIVAIFILFNMAYKAYRRSALPFSQVWAAALLVWSIVEMTHAAMRLAAIGFIFGLAFTQWYENSKLIIGRRVN